MQHLFITRWVFLRTYILMCLVLVPSLLKSINIQKLATQLQLCDAACSAFDAGYVRRHSEDIDVIWWMGENILGLCVGGGINTLDPLYRMKAILSGTLFRNTLRSDSLSSRKNSRSDSPRRPSVGCCK